MKIARIILLVTAAAVAGCKSSTVDPVTYTQAISLTVKNLPEGLQKAITGTKAEEFRLYESPDKYYYVIYIRSVVPSSVQPFGQVKEEIAQKVYGKKLAAGLEEWFTKLRETARIKMYLADTGK